MYLKYNIDQTILLGGYILLLMLWEGLIMVCAAETSEEAQNAKCKRKILMSYPDAKCYLANDSKDCKRICAEQGTERCQENKGEIRKLHCKKIGSDEEDKESSRGRPMTCCCTVMCEDSEAIAELLGNSYRLSL